MKSLNCCVEPINPDSNISSEISLIAALNLIKEKINILSSHSPLNIKKFACFLISPVVPYADIDRVVELKLLVECYIPGFTVRVKHVSSN